MDEIPDIQVDTISIPDNFIDTISPNIPNVQPITLTLEQPNLIFEIPGCVEANPDSGNNKNLNSVDDRGLKVFCDAGMPSFNPLVFTPEDIEPTPQPTTPKINSAKQKEEKKESNSTETNNNPPPSPQSPLVPKILPCPRPDDLPVGAIGKYGTKIIQGYKQNGNQCKVLYEERSVLEVVNTYTPPPSSILGTGLLATSSVVMVVTVGQPLAQWLQGKIKSQTKSLFKKVTKRLLAIRGKKPKVLSLSERRKAQKDLRK